MENTKDKKLPETAIITRKSETIGFISAVVSFVYRWISVQHIPMQNLFEVFLSLSVIYPLITFIRIIFNRRSEASDMLLSAVVLVPPGFILSSQPQHLLPSLQSWFFIPHVMSYMLAYIFMTKAGMFALRQLYSLYCG